ncbi:MAG: nuclear transport factor 2 family protein [Motilibacteraceae bacterium]
MTRDAASAVEAANTSLYTAVESADLDLMGALWLDGSEGDSVVCVHPGWPPLHGRSEVLRSWAAIMAGTSYVQFFLTDVQVSVQGDAAVVTCTENVLTGEEGGGSSFGFPGGRVATTNVFRRTAGGWRLWVHHASPVLSALEEEASDASDASDATGSGPDLGRGPQDRPGPDPEDGASGGGAP